MKTYRSWEITSWPGVLWKVPASRAVWPVFHHMGSDVRPDSDEYGRAVGDTVWAARIDDDQIFGLAWEWIEVKPGVPAIRDPNGFVSNVKLVSQDGDDLGELQSVVCLNGIVHSTDWQDTVGSVMRGGVAVPEDLHAPVGSLLRAPASAAQGELALLRRLVAKLPYQSRPLAAQARAR